MKTLIALCIAVEIPDEYRMDLTSEPVKNGGYLYTAHLHDRGPNKPWRDTITFDLADITSECERAITDRIQSIIAKTR